MQLNCGGRLLDLSRPQVMGILNVTPDSFSDGGRYLQLDAAIAQAERMVAAGAAIIDVGGESTRPGSLPVPEDEELRRVLPVVQALARHLPVPISIDTQKPAVMRAAVAAGAGFINDVNALRAPGAIETAAALGVPVCLMHMQGTPQTMQQAPHYQDVVAEVAEFLASRCANAEAAGIPAERIVIDPGIGFGKTLAHNLALLANLHRLAGAGTRPLLIGVSRKALLGHLLDLPVDERAEAGAMVAALAVWQGAAIVRTHDVAVTVRALKLCAALQAARTDALDREGGKS